MNFMILRMTHRSLLLVAVVLLISSTATLKAGGGDTLIIRNGFALRLPRGYAETVIAPNPVEAALAAGTFRTPSSGQPVQFPGGEESTWKFIGTDAEGWFEDSALAGCYLYASIAMREPRLMFLKAMGNEMVYINGSPRPGNPYGLTDVWESWEPHFDYSVLPVMLEKGKNEFLFRCSRGRLKATLLPASAGISFNELDVTIPDFVVGEEIDAWGSIVIINTSPVPRNNLIIRSTIDEVIGEPIAVPVIQPMTVRKVPFRMRAGAPRNKGEIAVHLSLMKKSDVRVADIDQTTIPVRVLERLENRKETFVSNIDGSIQYYGINPARDTSGGGPKALVLSLHGAAVEAINQSGSYYPKTWAHIVAPTNRRPYGFNWEEWGRTDALEVMDIVRQRYAIDEDRIYLTGHSMGGHGAWHLGSLFPDRFAALGPSAGWISFWTYRFRGQNLIDTSAIRKMIRKSTTPSETFQHLTNYDQLGLYILHGAEDDNVPVSEARSMVSKLEGHHRDFIYHEEPGVSHWWDISDEPGADCVDWPPMFDFFARHARPLRERVSEVRFSTSNPAVSSRNNWAAIDAQIRQLEMSSISLRYDPGLNRFTGTTDNVSRISLDLSITKTDETVTIAIDGDSLVIGGVKHQQLLWLERREGGWVQGFEPGSLMKGAHRYGTLKEAFGNRMVLVYGTKGSVEENRWAFNKARFDAEKLWYQGNASIDLVSDGEFNPANYPERNVIIYGNRNTNSAWDKLLRKSPVQMGSGYVSVGEERFSGEEISCIFVRPREGSRTASVAVIGGTGEVGMAITNRLPYLSPGIGLPDCSVFSMELLTRGEEGVLLSGYFGLDWSVERGEFVRKAMQK
jgi:dienelactone hydrolase